MNWFYNLKVARKLLLSFACVLVLTTALGALSIFQLNKVNQASTELASKWLPVIGTLGVLAPTEK